eukprot:3755284-Rhodomonas_salina.1
MRDLQHHEQVVFAAALGAERAARAQALRADVVDAVVAAVERVVRAATGQPQCQRAPPRKRDKLSLTPYESACPRQGLAGKDTGGGQVRGAGKAGLLLEAPVDEEEALRTVDERDLMSPPAVSHRTARRRTRSRAALGARKRGARARGSTSPESESRKFQPWSASTSEAWSRRASAETDTSWASNAPCTDSTTNACS